MKQLLFAASVLALLSFSVFSQTEGNPENWCRGGFFTRDSEEFKVATVDGPKGSKKYFYSDDSETEKCPESVACRLKTYLVPGDKIVANRVRGNSMCVWYTPAKGSPTVGWMRSEDLTVETSLKSAGIPEWLGEWKYAENSLKFTNNKLAGWLNVTGDAYWKGLGDNIHIGEIDGRVEPKDGVAEYSDGDDEFDCKVTMQILGKYLIVADNMKCGGMNVSFSGIYRKAK